MVEFAHILCPTDLSDTSRRSLTYALALARWYRAHLTVLYVVPTFDPMPVRSTSLDGPVQMVYPVSREEVLEELRRVVHAAGAGSMDDIVRAETGDPAGTIVDQALAIPADLVVMGTHGRSGSERFMIGSVAEKVVRRAPCPVLTVPPQVPAASPDDVRFRRILCPMDFSPSALQAFGFARDLARRAAGAVTLVHVIDWATDDEPRMQSRFDVMGYRQHLIDDARARLQTLIDEEPRTGSPIQDVVELGRPHREILRMAGDSAPDLIVMGAQGRGGLGLALFGSATQQVVRAAHCPVLTVRAIDRGRVQ